MKWVLGAAIAAVLCTGCRNPAPVYDPFMGRTTIPPPGTATPPPGQPYYAPPAGAMPPPGVPTAGGFSSFTPNVSTPRPAATPIPSGQQPVPVTPVSNPPQPNYGPPGGISPQAGLAPQYGTPTPAQAPPPTALAANQVYGSKALSPPAVQSSNVTPAVNWQPAGAAQPASQAGPASVSGPQDSQPIRIVPPPARSTVSAPSFDAGATGTLNQSMTNSRIPELGDLPPARFTAPGAVTLTPATPTPASPTRATGVQQASATAAAPRSTTTGSGYGYDPQYRWLRGKLEYSQSMRKWRLRYIPADGQTDDFGGSVILGDSPALAGLKSGDMVQVQGSLGAERAVQNSFAPLYDVAQLQKL